jgi:hypothetical protein
MCARLAHGCRYNANSTVVCSVFRHILSESTCKRTHASEVSTCKDMRALRAHQHKIGYTTCHGSYTSLESILLAVRKLIAERLDINIDQN